VGERREEEPGAVAPEGRAGQPPASRAVPAMPRDDGDDPRHEAVLATGPVGSGAGQPVPRRRDLVSVLARAPLELAALAVLVFAPALLGFAGLFAGLLLVAACRLWDSREKLVVALVVPVAAALFAVFVAWLRATQVSQAESSRTRVSIAWHALTDGFAALPVTVGVLAAVYLAVRLASALADGR
jgi:hypothetical protein